MTAVEPQPAGTEPRRAIRIASTTLVIAPIVIAARVRAVTHDWFPVSDDALLYIRARDVLTAHHPLLGSWTSASQSVGIDMNNPGPLYDDLIAPFAHLLDYGPGAAVGVGAVNAASVAAISAWSHSIGGWRLQRLMLAASALLTWAMGSELLIDIWQAHALLLPFLLFLTLMTGIAVRRARCIPWAVGVASLLVQTHISYIYALVVISTGAMAVAWWPHRRERPSGVLRMIPRRQLTLGAAVFAICWVQPVIEQLTSSGQGNLARLVTHAGGGDVQVGLGNSLRLSARVLFEPPWRLRTMFSTLIPVAVASGPPDDRTFGFGGQPAVPLAALLMIVLIGGTVLLARWAHRSGQPVEAAACAVAAITLMAAALCVSLVTVGAVGLAQHHLRWLWVVGAFADAAIVSTLVSMAVVRWRRLRGPWWRSPMVAVTVILAILGVPYCAQQQGPVALYYSMPTLRRVFPQLERLRADAPVVFDISTLQVFEPYSSTVLMHLQQIGIDFKVTDEGMVRQLGERRRATGDEQATIFQLQGAPVLSYTGPACLVAGASRLTAADDDRFRTEAEAIAAAIIDGAIFINGDQLPDVEFELLTSIDLTDRGTAMQITTDHTLERWSAAGAVELITTPRPDLSRLTEIATWADGYYAVFMTGATRACVDA